MTNFEEALAEGISFARSADQARKEIDEVFTQLDEQVLRASKGKLSIRRGRRAIKKPFPETLADRFSWPPKPPETYPVILASNPTEKDGPEREIAQWSQESTGYPCRVRWGDQQHICEDREALSECLADLLRDPEVASTLLRLMNLKPAEEQAKDPQ